MMPAFIIIGSRIMPGDLSAVLVEHTLERGEVVERHDAQQIGHLLRRRPGRARDAVRASGPSWSAERKIDTIAES